MKITILYWCMFVGVFMIVLGVWYILKAYMDRKNIDNNDALYEEARMIKESNNANNNDNNVNKYEQ